MSKKGKPSEGQSPDPTTWAIEQKWRELTRLDAVQAFTLRVALARTWLYPTRPMDQLDDTTEVVNCRCALQEMINLLDPTDLIAIFKAARLLLLIQRPDDFYQHKYWRP